MTPRITVIGIGDDGLSGLTPPVRRLIDEAEVLVGGERHQAMVTGSKAERMTWADGIEAVASRLARMAGRRIVVLATGDPMWFGVGVNLSRCIDPAAMSVIPQPSAFSLAAARMLWPLADTETLSIHGRPLECLNAVIQPGVRLLALSRDGDTPAAVARLLTERGYGASLLTVLEHLGGPMERRLDGVATSWDHPRAADLNIIAIECRTLGRALVLPPVPGLPDDVFATDGKLTKREVRAVTIAALAPLPGQVLWDVGAGSGSVGIEWLRSLQGRPVAHGREAMAVAIERDADRCADIARNARALGVPGLKIEQRTAPDGLAALEPRPDTIFVGGGVSDGSLLDRCWSDLKSGGRLVANAVTIDAWQQLFGFHDRHGGELRRIAIARGESVGRLRAFRPMMDVVQYIGIKP